MADKKETTETSPEGTKTRRKYNRSNENKQNAEESN